MKGLKWATGIGALVLFALTAWCLILVEWALWRNWDIDVQFLQAHYIKALCLAIAFAALLISFVALVIASQPRSARRRT